MKKFLTLGLVLGLAISFIGCDQAKDAVDAAKDASADAVDAAKDMGDKALEGVDFGDFDMAGLKDKFSGITEGFDGLTADNAGGLVDKITGLTGSIGDMGFGSLGDTAKAAVGKLIGPFIESINGLVGKISDEGIMGKVKPAVEALVTKLKTMM